MRALALSIVILVASLGAANAQVLFTDDFEGDLAQWVGQSNGAHHGAIVSDPLNPSNRAVVFTALNSAGDIFSPEITVLPGYSYVLSFDYLGYALPDSPADNFGGFIGVADETSGLSSSTVSFLGGTVDEHNILVDLVDDGNWHSYYIAFDPYSRITISDGGIHVTIEDWQGLNSPAGFPAGVSGDAFFDNIRLERTGPVAAEATTWGQIKALYR
jgi:hypothetical protein